MDLRINQRGGLFSILLNLIRQLRTSRWDIFALSSPVSGCASCQVFCPSEAPGSPSRNRTSPEKPCTKHVTKADVVLQANPRASLNLCEAQQSGECTNLDPEVIDTCSFPLFSRPRLSNTQGLILLRVSHYFTLSHTINGVSRLARVGREDICLFQRWGVRTSVCFLWSLKAAKSAAVLG
jgi:hypothetical protein